MPSQDHSTAGSKAVAVECCSHGTGVDLVRIGSRRLQREVHEVKAVPPEPVNLLQWLASRVVHRTDLHGKTFFGTQSSLR